MYDKIAKCRSSPPSIDLSKTVLDSLYKSLQLGHLAVHLLGEVIL